MAGGLAAQAKQTPQNHVTVVAVLGGARAWAEPAIPGARLGESPYAAAVRLGGRPRLAPPVVDLGS